MEITKSFPQQETEINGVWLPYRDGSQIKIARLGNSKFRAMYAEKTSALQKYVGDVNQKDLDLIMIECLADTILLGWKGFTKDGSDFPYNKRNAVWMLTEISDFSEDIIKVAGEREHFFTNSQKEQEKNSVISLTGS